jgi:hypothetical protein
MLGFMDKKKEKRRKKKEIKDKIRRKADPPAGG